MSNMTFVFPDHPFLSPYPDIIGWGTNGIVVKCGEHALKLPKLESTVGLTEERRKDREFINNVNIEVIEKEKRIYERLGPHEGIARCVNIDELGIMLEYVPNGSLADRVATCDRPAWQVRREWILTIAKTMQHIHQRQVLVDDLALRNFLLDEHDCVKMIDFGQSALLDLDVDIFEADDHGLTVQADIFHLGCVIYSLSTWINHELNLFDHGYKAPPLEELPDLSDLAFGSVITKCWQGRYRGMDKICRDVQDVCGEG